MVGLLLEPLIILPVVLHRNDLFSLVKFYQKGESSGKKMQQNLFSGFPN